MRPKAPKHKRKPNGKSPTHLDLIRRLPCILSGKPAEAAHIRYADAAHGKEVTGMGRKPDDKWCLPLAPELHRMLKGCQHDSAERDWWAQFGIDPLAVCKLLWDRSYIQMQNTITMKTPWNPEIKAKVAAILRGAK